MKVQADEIHHEFKAPKGEGFWSIQEDKDRNLSVRWMRPTKKENDERVSVWVAQMQNKFASLDQIKG